MTNHLSQNHSTPTAIRTPHAHRDRWLTVLAAMASATAVGVVADPLLGLDLIVERGSSVTDVFDAILLTSLFVGFAAWGLLALLETRVRRPRRVWTMIAASVFVLSLLGPMSGSTAGATVVLMLLHVLVASILILGMRSTVADPAG